MHQGKPPILILLNFFGLMRPLVTSSVTIELDELIRHGASPSQAEVGKWAKARWRSNVGQLTRTSCWAVRTL